MRSPGGRLQAASKPLDQIVMAITECLNSGVDGELVHSDAESGEAVSPRPAQICRSLASNCQTILNHRSLQDAQTLPAYPNGRGTLHCPSVDLACPDHLRRLCGNSLWSGCLLAIILARGSKDLIAADVRVLQRRAAINRPLRRTRRRQTAANKLQRTPQLRNLDRQG